MATQKNKYTNIDLSKYDAGYQASQAVIDAEKRKKEAEDAVENYGDFYYKNQGALDLVLQNLKNRKFSYDLNADALYQQYKDNYITQGKQAMVDTMGQAAALTGGYGNSYAATVGNQTYQGYLTQLNNIAPELYKLALDKYNSEGTDLMNQIGAFQSDRSMEYGIWGDGLNRLMQDRSYYSDDYNNASNRDYTMWNDNRSYDTTQYWNEYNAGYQAEQDAITQANWEKEFELAQKQYQASLVKRTGSGEPKTPTAEMFEKARQAYSSGGQTALEQYADMYPEYDYEALFDYATTYGSYTEPEYKNVVGKNNYRNAGASRDKFDSGVRSNYSKNKK